VTRPSATHTFHRHCEPNARHEISLAELRLRADANGFVRNNRRNRVVLRLIIASLGRHKHEVVVREALDLFGRRADVLLAYAQNEVEKELTAHVSKRNKCRFLWQANVNFLQWQGGHSRRVD
jgi:hypothetical protein